MGNIYRLNSFYEWELQSFPNSLSLNPNLKAKVHSLEYAFAGLLQEEDELFLEHSPSLKFIEYLSKKFSREIVVNRTLSASKNLIEWGIIRKLQNSSFIYDTETISLHKRISSKLKQGEIREQVYPHLPTRFLVRDIVEIEKVLSQVQFPLLLKPEHTLSGVGTYILQTKEHFQSLSKDLELKLQNQVYFLEEWKEKIFDFSALCDSDKGFISLTKMNVDSRGKYQSSEITKDEELEKNYFKLLENLNKLGFLPKGKFSIDGFIYLENGKKVYNYISEINPRWTMGWLLYEFQKKYARNFRIGFVPNQYKDLDFFELEEILSRNLNLQQQNLILLSPPFLEKTKLASILILNIFHRDNLFALYHNTKEIL